ncbi:MAG: family 43 glycosylhydrolase [Bacteroidales bacterium]|nr:family 43 glycosylhydrolase [Bacteroidales bacterium]
MRLILFALLTVIISSSVNAQKHMPKPLFADPTYNGSCDPEIVWNEHEQEWWVFYTGRRPAVKNGIYAGCAIGVAASKDWINWEFKGYCKVDGVGGIADSPDTYWAPGIIKEGDTYHMFITFKKGSPGLWGGRPELMYHLKAPANDLLNGWKTVGGLQTFPTGIDAGICKKDDTYYMYHRDICKEDSCKGKGINTKYMTSKNLYKWEKQGWAKGDINNKAVNGYSYQEGQYVFYWKNYFWLLTDPHGPDIAVYRSDDCENWKYVGGILNVSGEEETDGFEGRHASVAVVGDRAFIFYHVEPYTEIRKKHKKEKIYDAKDFYAFIQVAELEFKDGNITCDREKKIVPPKNLKLKTEYWGQSNN